MTEADTVYFNTNEHYRQAVETQTREDRFISKCKRDFPAHQSAKSFPILQQIRGVKEAEEIALMQTACNITEKGCLLYTSPSPRDQRGSRMPSSA